METQINCTKDEHNVVQMSMDSWTSNKCSINDKLKNLLNYLCAFKENRNENQCKQYIVDSIKTIKDVISEYKYITNEDIIDLLRICDMNKMGCIYAYHVHVLTKLKINLKNNNDNRFIYCLRYLLFLNDEFRDMFSQSQKDDQNKYSKNKYSKYCSFMSGSDYRNIEYVGIHSDEQIFNLPTIKVDHCTGIINNNILEGCIGKIIPGVRFYYRIPGVRFYYNDKDASSYRELIQFANFIYSCNMHTHKIARNIEDFMWRKSRLNPNNTCDLDEEDPVHGQTFLYISECIREKLMYEINNIILSNTSYHFLDKKKKIRQKSDIINKLLIYIKQGKHVDNIVCLISEAMNNIDLFKLFI